MTIEVRTGIGFDVHKFSYQESESNYLTLGGIRIPFVKKLEAHSDGDVVIHAIVDALLGSISAGDIGIHFPPTDLQWKDADSKYFLIYAHNLLKQKNAKINNIDVTVICQKPNISIYREKMIICLAETLAIEINRINIKATTTEKLGFTGREEGIATQAIATISLLSTSDK